jgi:hypothetical protein
VLHLSIRPTAGLHRKLEVRFAFGSRAVQRASNIEPFAEAEFACWETYTPNGWDRMNISRNNQHNWRDAM